MSVFTEAIDSLPRSIVLAIQFTVIGIVVGLWWSGNQAQINEVQKLKESVDKLRGELTATYIGKHDFLALQKELNWRIKIIDKRLGIEYVEIRVGEY